MGGEGQPCEQKCERARFTCPKKHLRVDLPDRNAEARLEASEAMCPLSFRAVAPRALAKVAACGQYESVSPLASIRACKSHTRGQECPKLGLCSAGKVAIWMRVISSITEPPTSAKATTRNRVGLDSNTLRLGGKFQLT